MKTSRMLLCAALAGTVTCGVRAQNGDLALASNDAGRVLMKWEDFKKVTRWDERSAPAGADKDRFTVTWNETLAKGEGGRLPSFTCAWSATESEMHGSNTWRRAWQISGSNLLHG